MPYTSAVGADATTGPSPHGLADADDAQSSQLQSIVDEASRVMGRPVAIDDRHLRMLAFTEHREDDVDRYRLMSIMKQPYPAEMIRWLEAQGLWAAELPTRIPPNPELEYEARIAAPMHCQGHHFGWVWCMDREQSMSDADLERLAAFADEAALVLYRDMLVLDLNRSRERELLRDILSVEENIRREAAFKLAELELFTPGGRVVVAVIPLATAADDRSPDSLRMAVESVLLRVRRRLAPKHGLHLVRPDHALILVSLTDPSIRVAGGVTAFAERIHAELTSSPHADSNQRQIVAIGGVAGELTGALASYTQALRTADVAKTLSSFGDIVSWDDLGIYQMLTEIPIGVFGPNVLHPGLGRLLAQPRGHDLVSTLERFLDLAGDVQRTAASLYMHRTTLYHRLRRIERVADVDLRNGDDRVALHLSLKLARLQGVTWPSSDASPGEPQAMPTEG